jgi:hypothetical protein
MNHLKIVSLPFLAQVKRQFSPKESRIVRAYNLKLEKTSVNIYKFCVSTAR